MVNALPAVIEKLADLRCVQVLRRRHQVHVVGHQPAGVDLQAVPVSELPEQRAVDAVVVVDEEDVLAVVAALRDAVRHTRDNDPCDTSQEGSITERPGLLNLNR